MFSTTRTFFSRLVDDELSYNITRPHPYSRNFKLSIFAASFVVLALLTVVNLATNGYDKQPVYSDNPNKTATELQWYNHKIFTWGDDTLEPKCENIDLRLGHQFLTSNQGLTWTVQKITSPDGQPQASVSYHANTLTNCEVSDVGISLRNSGFAKPRTDIGMPYKWEPWIISTADASAKCNITTEGGNYTLGFKTEYKTYTEHFTFLATSDPQGHAPFWWGARLMNAYFVGTQYVMSGPLPDANNDTEVFTAARLSYEVNEESKKKPIKDPLLFAPWFYFLGGATGVRETKQKQGLTTEMLYNNGSYAKSRPLTEGMLFAKVFRSVILADLGNSETENLVLKPELLQYALNPGSDDFNRIDGAPLAYNKSNPDWWMFTGIAPPDKFPSGEVAIPFHEAYDKLKDQTGKLETKPAIINSVYTCSVPRKKSRTAMFLFTLVANLTLFQTAWGLFKHVLDQRTTWKDAQANYCEGCVKGYAPVAMVDGMGTPMMAMKSPSIGGSSTKALLRGEEGYT